MGSEVKDDPARIARGVVGVLRKWIADSLEITGRPLISIGETEVEVLDSYVTAMVQLEECEAT